MLMSKCEKTAELFNSQWRQHPLNLMSKREVERLLFANGGNKIQTLTFFLLKINF